MNKKKGLDIAFVAQLSPKKLKQKLAPLIHLEEVRRIDLYTRYQCEPHPKVRWMNIRGKNKVLGELHKLCKLLWNARKYDCLIGCFQQYHGYYAYLAGRLFRRPAVQLVITDPAWNYERGLARRAMLGSAACGVRGPVSAEKLRGYGYTGKIFTAHNPMELSAQPTGSTMHAAHDLLAVGAFAPEKDYPWMLRVLRRVADTLPDTTLAMAGAGLEENLSPLARELGLMENIRFLGQLDEPALNKAYAESRLLLLTSDVEGLPMVVLEALSHGLPVACTRVGELPWLLRDKAEARLAEHGDTGAMAQAVLDILSNTDLEQAMRRQALDRFQEIKNLFSLEAISEEWRSVLQALS